MIVPATNNTWVSNGSNVANFSHTYLKQLFFFHSAFLIFCFPLGSHMKVVDVNPNDEWINVSKYSYMKL